MKHLKLFEEFTSNTDSDYLGQLMALQKDGYTKNKEYVLAYIMIGSRNKVFHFRETINGELANSSQGISLTIKEYYDEENPHYNTYDFQKFVIEEELLDILKLGLGEQRQNPGYQPAFRWHPQIKEEYPHIISGLRTGII